jgi:hypothetical protein
LIPKIITVANKTQRITSALTFQSDTNKIGMSFSTGDENWVAIVNVETKEQSKYWMHTHSPNKPK